MSGPDDRFESSSPSAEWTCPHCAHALGVAQTDLPQEVLCPDCGGPIMVPALDGTTVPEEEESDQRLLRRAPREDEIDGQRIRHFTVARRALIRARTYALVAALGCVFAIVKAILVAAEWVGARGWTVRPLVYLLIAVLAAGGLVHFIRRLADLTRELNRADPPETDLPPPDFTHLSDGSQHWKNLDQM